MYFLSFLVPCLSIYTFMYFPKMFLWNEWWFYNRWFFNFSDLYCVWEDNSRVHISLSLVLLYSLDDILLNFKFVARGVTQWNISCADMEEVWVLPKQHSRVTPEWVVTRGETIWFSPLEYLISTQILLHFIIERSHANDVGACFRGRKKKES